MDPVEGEISYFVFYVRQYFQDIFVFKSLPAAMTQSREKFYILLIREALKKKIRDYLGIFPNMGGGGLPNSQNPKPKKKCL